MEKLKKWRNIQEKGKTQAREAIRQL